MGNFFHFFQQTIISVISSIAVFVSVLNPSNIPTPTPFHIQPTEVSNPVPAQTIIVKPTIEEETSCLIGSFTVAMPSKYCTDVQQFVHNEKQKDMIIVAQRANILNQQRQGLLMQLTQIPFYTNQAVNCSAACGGGGLTVPSVINQCLQNCGSSFNNQSVLNQQARTYLMNEANTLADQINWYRQYISQIPLGVGNGACSDHGGVSCMLKKGEIGQVICNDGWRQSQVYYYNVKECMEYLISTALDMIKNP